MAATRTTIAEADGILNDVNDLLDRFMADEKKLAKPHNDEFKAGNYAIAIQMAHHFRDYEKKKFDTRLDVIKNTLKKALAAVALIPIRDQTDDANMTRQMAEVARGGVQDISDAYDSFCEKLQNRIDAGVEILSVELTAEDLIRYGNKESKQEKVEEKTQEKKSTQQPFSIPITSGLVQHGLLSAPPSPPRLTTAPVFIPSQNNTVRLART